MNKENDLIGNQIVGLIGAITNARRSLEQEHNTPIEPGEIEAALVESFNLEDSNQLLDLNLNSDRIVQVLRDYDFEKLRPETLGKVEFDTSIVPHGVPVLLTEQKVKAGGEIWYIHKNDADPFPSNPHAHNYAKDLILDLSNGDLFRKRKVVGNITRKDLLLVRSSIGQISLPALRV